MSVGVLSGEFTNRLAGTTGWKGVAVKGVTKGVVGTALYFGAQKLSDKGRIDMAFFTELAAYSAMGSIIPDVVASLYPGGLQGVAEDMATTAKAFALGGRRTLGAMRRMSPPAGMPPFPNQRSTVQPNTPLSIF